ncbi:helix-turn-helix domain-containing protein [Nonomuraea jabiensis]|uniref:helix-turn-helix domain-containing protein n=1 Tax=Nonomuraea jabiensis TaxID=882448 RepID=UPI003D74940E
MTTKSELRERAPARTPQGTVVVDLWTAHRACALRTALRLTLEAFADRLGIAARTVASWEAHPDKVPTPAVQAILDTALAQADEAAGTRFLLLSCPPPRRSCPRRANAGSSRSSRTYPPRT